MFSKKTLQYLPPLLCLLLSTATAAPAASSPSVTVPNTSAWRRAGLVNGAVLCPPAVSVNAALPLPPASILKIATALWALETLGPEYRFVTDFMTTDSGDLIIKGSGDPMLIAEEVDAIAGILRNKGLSRIRRLIIDDSAFATTVSPGSKGSLNPYDADPGAVAVNFNTALIRYDQRRQKILSAEPQTPTLPLMAGLPKPQAGRTKRINVTAAGVPARRYARQLFTALLAAHGITVIEPHRQQVAGQAEKTRLLYRHYSSYPLATVVERMLLYSNNFIANQLFLHIGAEQQGYPADWRQSRQAMAHFMENRLALTPPACVIVDGAGLDRGNRISARAMLTVLEAFAPFQRLLPVRRGHRVKSGTLTGVHNYAGYLDCAEHPRPFIIMLEQKTNSRDRLLDRLAATCCDQ